MSQFRNPDRDYWEERRECGDDYMASDRYSSGYRSGFPIKKNQNSKNANPSKDKLGLKQEGSKTKGKC